MKVRMRICCNDRRFQLPRRAHWFDAGLDCYAAEDVILEPGELRKVSLGFALQIPHGNVVLLTPRSSMNARGIDVKLGTIDSEYEGVIIAVVKNSSKEPVRISFDTKLCQLIMMPIHEIEPIEANDYDVQNLVRGINGFGSTDKKEHENDVAKSR